MTPTGVRLACPDCTLDVVMTSETDCPAPVTKVIEGVPYCPNCNLPMRPVASVDVTPKPERALAGALTLEQCAKKCAEIAREVETAARPPQG
jgi:hypothetical protein